MTASILAQEDDPYDEFEDEDDTDDFEDHDDEYFDDDEYLNDTNVNGDGVREDAGTWQEFLAGHSPAPPIPEHQGNVPIDFCKYG